MDTTDIRTNAIIATTLDEYAALYHDPLGHRREPAEVAHLVTTGHLRNVVPTHGFDSVRDQAHRYVNAHPEVLRYSPPVRAQRRAARAARADQLRNLAQRKHAAQSYDAALQLLDEAEEIQPLWGAVAAHRSTRYDTLRARIHTARGMQFVPGHVLPTAVEMDVWELLIKLDLLTEFTTAAGTVLRDLIVTGERELNAEQSEEIAEVAQYYTSSILDRLVRDDPAEAARAFGTYAHSAIVWNHLGVPLTGERPSDPINPVAIAATAALTWVRLVDGQDEADHRMTALGHSS
ncbi:hypothetical protein ACTD5D_40415 [Nocardia takedensis]|uniref:hypothetical protein n=1 Tax=Nocardia takedensis TaxID=259390 RepID=UPI003F75DA6D